MAEHPWWSQPPGQAPYEKPRGAGGVGPPLVAGVSGTAASSVFSGGRASSTDHARQWHTDIAALSVARRAEVAVGEAAGRCWSSTG